MHSVHIEEMDRASPEASQSFSENNEQLVHSLTHLIPEAEAILATSVSSASGNGEARMDADPTQDLDNKLVSEALEAWLAHHGHLDLRTLFNEDNRNGRRSGAKSPDSAAFARPSSILGNTTYFPRTNQLVSDTTSVRIFYSWLHKTLSSRLPTELIFLIAHASLHSNEPSAHSVPAIPSLYSYYLPHLYPYPGPCAVHILNCPQCCTLVPTPPAVPNTNVDSGDTAARSKPCSSLTSATPYTPISPDALRRLWGYREMSAVRKDGDFEPCADSGALFWDDGPRKEFDEENGAWRCGCRASEGPLYWNAETRRWNCATLPVVYACCMDDWDEEREKAIQDAARRCQEAKKIGRMQWTKHCRRCLPP